jgi:hypothetical protein
MHTKAEQGNSDRIRPNQSRPESHGHVPGGYTVSGRDIGASVMQRLLNKSRTQSRPFQELLKYFAIESDSCIGLQNRQTRIGSY